MQITIYEAPFCTVSLQPAPFFLLDISTLFSYLFSDNTVYILPVRCEKTFTETDSYFLDVKVFIIETGDKIEVVSVYAVELYGIGARWTCTRCIRSQP